MGKFSVMDLMNSKSKGQVQDKEKYQHIKLKLEEMTPSEENFYSMGEIEELAKSILLVGLQQPIVLAKVDDRYKVISGHRRRAALKWLVSQGYRAFEEIECLVAEMTENMFNLSIIVGNAFSRKMTDYDLMMQEKKLKEALLKAKEAGEIEIKGKLRDCIAELLDLSSTKVAQIEAINNNLSDEVKEEVMKGQVSFSNAYEISKLDHEEQKEILEKVQQEEVKGKDIKQMVIEKKEQREQQRKEEMMDQEAIPSLRQPACPEQLGQVVKVSDSDTLETKTNELTIPDVLQELLEMYHLINLEEFQQLIEIHQSCNERMRENGE